MKKKLRSIAVLLACVFTVLTLLVPSLGYAAKTESKVVRVGWFQSDMFQEGTSDSEEKSGYCYDYLQKVADYTRWQYEYVYGDWTELFRKLQKGEIDLLGGVSLSEERRQTMLFPDSAMGMDQYYLYKKANNTAISASDMSTLKGKKVGGILDNRMTAFTEKWIKDNKLDLEIVYFASFAAQNEAFDKGEIDLLTQTINNVLSMENIAIVAKVGEEPFFLAVNKSRPDLLSELNGSLTTMLSLDPFILQNLQYANYGANLTNKTMSAEEARWLTEHKKLRVGYLDNYMPFSATDAQGKVAGLLPDVVNGITTSLHQQDKLELEYKPFANYAKMIEALKQGEIDTAFPVFGHFATLEKEKISASSTVVANGAVLVYKSKGDPKSIKRIAVNKNNSIQQEYTQRTFKDREICYYENIDDCLDAVIDGAADAVIMNAMRMELVTRSSKYNSLSYVQLEKGTNLCFAVDENDTTLLLLLNRGLRILGPAFGTNVAHKYAAGLYSVDIVDYIYENIFAIGVFVVLIAGLAIAFLLRDVRNKERRVKEKDRLNKELEEAKLSAEAANNAKTTFLNNMSHDIRTPMNAILGFASLIEKEKQNPEAVGRYIGKIKGSGEYLLSIINNVLNMARIESGKATVDEEFFDLYADETNILNVFDASFREKNLKLIANMDVQHRYVLLDKAKTMEIAANLISNAIKYTPNGGTVTVEFREEPSTRPGYAKFVNTVADTGIGMSKDFQENIFEAFTREKNTTESKIIGSGLGMAIVKKLVDLLGGTIEVESELGKGSAFRVTLEHRIVEHPEKYLKQQKQALEQAAYDFKGKRILLAEDNELNAEIAQELLSGEGFIVEHAKDGVECIDMLSRAEVGYYDFILMDIQMPNLDGYTATRKIRRLSDSAKAAIPIIAMTANAFDEDKRRALEAGMNGFCTKPVSVDMLNKEIAKFIK